MATLHNERGFAFHVFPNDHQPAHIHAVKGDGDLRIDVSGEDPVPLGLRGKMSDKDINRALDIAEDNLTKFKEGWMKFHDPVN